MLPEDLLASFQQFFQTDNVIYLWRMTVDREAFTPPPPSAQVRRLNGDDAEALRTLYAKGMGGPRPEEVETMTPDSIEKKWLFAVEQTGEIVAVAGAHIFAPEEKVGVVGYVYTAPEHRGKGYARQATAAVTAALFDGGVDQVLLNVARSNQPAIRVYEQLGYKRHCPIVEGPALKRGREI